MQGRGVNAKTSGADEAFIICEVNFEIGRAGEKVGAPNAYKTNIQSLQDCYRHAESARNI